ncbi:arsenate reductase ArsC [Amycolatopsis sp. cmx-4-61]|uniref:arsenate reductase ArsC n=1 Tax=Amycolatopsis sp. cmx-4-61 TaxID=2790937 RepID=UPI00397BFC55
MTHATDGLPARAVGLQLDRIADELADRFHGVFGRETVELFVRETYDLLAEHATVTVHLPARFARERLLDLGRAEGLTQVTVPQVLFLCVHNVGRSQMAAALLDHHAFGRVAVRSAGSQPKGEIPEIITAALRELHVPLEAAYPKPLTDEVLRASDVVVTMGCGDACAIYPGKRYLDWDIPDPAGEPLYRVRQIRDEIDRHVRGLLDELSNQP